MTAPRGTMNKFGSMIDKLNDLADTEPTLPFGTFWDGSKWHVHQSEEEFRNNDLIWTVETSKTNLESFKYRWSCWLGNVEVFCLSDRRP